MASSQRRAQLETAVQMALEQIRSISAKQSGSNASSTVRSDLYHLGCALYQNLTGSPPQILCAKTGQAGVDAGNTTAVGADATVHVPVDESSTADTARLRMVDAPTRPSKREKAFVDSTMNASMALDFLHNDRTSGIVPLKDLGYPVSISLLVDDLLQQMSNHGSSSFHDSAGSFLRSSSDTFATIDDVHQELTRMRDNPDRYLMDDPAATTGQLVFPADRLYGRDAELQQLIVDFHRVIESSPASADATAEQGDIHASALPHEHGLVLVKGTSGSGKSVLVDQLRKPLTANNNGMMLSCKFDSQVQPMSTIFRAFEDYCTELLASGNEALISTVKADVAAALGSSSDITLISLIPSLAELLGITNQTSPNGDVTAEAFDRIVYSLRSFVRAIAAPSHPVIILFDDLQWADQSTLDVIVMLVTDAENNSILFVGCYRDNEPSAELEQTLLTARNTKVPVTEIRLGELDGDAVNDLVADTLHLSPHLTQSLSVSIHAKTRGNPLFVVQLMKSLYDDKLLRYSASARRWTWDIETIQAESIADNAVDLMLEMMRSNSDEAQWVLRVASCLGSKFEEKAIRMLYLSIDNDPSGALLSQILSSLVEDGLLLPDGEGFRFAHDQIWEASYSLTPEAEREVMHMELGRELLRRARAAGKAEFETMLFAIVDQINHGASELTDPDEKVQVAELNLLAGEKASRACAFLPASVYLLQGCVFLDEGNSWRDHYELSLRLHTALGEVQVAHGDNESAILSLEPVLKQGKTIRDQLRAQNAFMLALIAKGELNDAVQRGLKVLEQLGESFPANIDEATVREELDKTEALIQGKTIENILQYHLIADENKIAAMKFLTVTARIAYNSNQTFFSLSVLRMINISMVNGLCPESSFAFASAALLLCNFGRRDLATHCADIALALLKKFNGQYEHVVLLILGLSIHQYRQPQQACLDRLRQAGRLAIASGDVMWAIATIGFVAFNEVYVIERGKTLQDVEAEMRAYIQEWSSYRHFSMDFVMLSFQAVLNLVENTSDDANGDPSVLTGEAMEQEKALAAFEEMNLITLKREMLHLRMYLAYLFHRYDLAAELYNRYKEVAKVSQIFPTVEVVSATLYSGLIAAAMLQRGGDMAVWRPIACEASSKMKEWAEKDSAWNFSHRHALLRAELAAVDGDHNVAVEAYQEAMSAAATHSFVNDHALATERTGLYFLQNSYIAEAVKHLQQAKSLYEEWGSQRKAAHVARMVPLDSSM